MDNDIRVWAAREASTGARRGTGGGSDAGKGEDAGSSACTGCEANPRSGCRKASQIGMGRADAVDAGRDAWGSESGREGAIPS